MASCHRLALRLLSRLLKLSGTHWLGHQTGLTELISAPGLKAPVMIQYRGKVNRMARMTKITTEAKR